MWPRTSSGLPAGFRMCYIFTWRETVMAQADSGDLVHVLYQIFAGILNVVCRL
jgi:hypothetical protein